MRPLHFFFLLLSIPVSAQWSVSPTGTTEPLYDLSNHGQYWLAGSFGSILYSANDGASWTKRDLIDPVFQIPIAQDVRCVSLTGPQQGFVSGTFFLGNTQTVATSTDAFQTLSLNAINSGGNYPRVIHDWVFPQASVGFACGANHNLLKTTNGGQTWSPIYNTLYELFGIDFISVSTGLAVGPYQALRTTNGGASWQTTTIFDNLVDVSMVSAQVAYAVSESKIYKTVDGGVTWEPRAVQLGTLRCVKAIDEHTVLVGAIGGIFLVENDGQGWSSFTETRILLPDPVGYVGVNNFYQSGATWWAACDQGYLMKTNNFGPTEPLALANIESSGGNCDPFHFKATASCCPNWWNGVRANRRSCIQGSSTRTADGT